MVMRSPNERAGWRADCGAPVPGTSRRFFPGRVINEGAGLITLEVPEAVPHGSPLSLSVRVNWSLVVAKAIATFTSSPIGTATPCSPAWRCSPTWSRLTSA